VEFIDFGHNPGEPITDWGSHGATHAPLARGDGDAHVTVVHIQPGGELGRHPTGWAQLWVIVSGSGWVSENDGPRVEMDAGEAVLIERGTVHAKGSAAGMTALVVQVTNLHRTTP
jgi:quercetin dioxygenase-like cupin family protein